MRTQLEVSTWLLETAKLYCEQINNYAGPDEALKFAEACYEDINFDIDGESPQDCIDGEIDAMRSDL